MNLKMAIYNAPKPTYTNWQWAKFIALRVFFPPVLLWDLLKLGVNKLVGKIVGRLVLPAQDMAHYYRSINDASAYNSAGMTCEKHTVITHDGAELDTFEVTHPSQKDIDPKYQKYIINLVGNGMSYTQIPYEMLDDAKELEANVVGFDLRGVNQSTGQPQSKDDLVTDCIAQVQRLLDKGVSPQNITLKAHSLGAGIASLVAHHFHQQGKPINIFSSRSFSNITDFVIGHMRLKRDEDGNALGQEETTVGKIIGWLVKPFIKLGVLITNWEINAAKAFRNIPEQYREYIAVRSRKGIRADRIDDALIPHYASIYNSLKDERRSKKAVFDKQIAETDDTAQLKAARKRVGSVRKMETEYALDNGHNERWDDIKNRYGVNALQFFRQFVRGVEKDHGVQEETSSPVYN